MWKSLSCVWRFVTPWTAAFQAPLSMILQARILRWVAILFSRGSSQSRDWTQVSCISGRFFTTWARLTFLEGSKNIYWFVCVEPSLWAFLVAQLVKNLRAMQETWVWSLGWEDPLEKEKATHSSILAWRIPWTGLQRVRQLSDFHNNTTTIFVSQDKSHLIMCMSLNVLLNLVCKYSVKLTSIFIKDIGLQFFL